MQSLIVTVTCFLLIGRPPLHPLNASKLTAEAVLTSALRTVAVSSLCLWVTVTAPTTLFSPRGLEVSTLGSMYASFFILYLCHFRDLPPPFAASLPSYVFVAFSLPTSIVLLYRAIREPGSAGGPGPPRDPNPFAAGQPPTQVTLGWLRGMDPESTRDLSHVEEGPYTSREYRGQEDVWMEKEGGTV